MDYDRPKKASFFKVRLIIAILASFCPITCYISRQNLSMAIVSMVDDQRPDTVATVFQQRNITSSPTAPQSLSSTWVANETRINNNNNLIDDSNNNGNITANNNNNNNQRLDSSSSSLSDLEAALAATKSDSTKVEKFEDNSCPIDTVFDESGQSKQGIVKSYGPKYKWESSDKSLIFSAFFWTYVLFQIPAARVAERVGAKWILAISAIGSSILSFLSPWAASVHVYALVFVRALMGICQTALFPACYVLYAKWLPPVERSLAISVLNVGAYIGSIFASSLTGYFSEQERFGWEWAFYTPGALCAIWFVLWLWQGSNRPRDHKAISLEEIEYIESKMEMRGDLCGGMVKKKEISWIKLVKSRSIWAMVAAFFASNWSFTIVLLLLPSYLNDILHIPPFKNGLINSVIYGLYCITSPIVGSGSTMMVETRAFGLSRLNIRKLFECTALFGQALCFLAVPLIGCDQTWVLSFLFLQIILFSFTNGGEVHLPTELSVDFSGTIYAIGNCIGSSTGFIAPILHSAIVSNSHSRAQWDTFFYLAAVICFFGGLMFIIFGQNQLQDFSKDLHESQLDICQQSKGVSSFSLAGSSFVQQQHQETQEKKPAPLRPLLLTRSTPPINNINNNSLSTTAARAAWMEAAIQQHEHGGASLKL